MMAATGTLLHSLAVLAVMSGGEMLRFFLLFALAAALALIGFYVTVAVRRWTQRDDNVANFTFQDLRDMKARGEITEQEFRAMRSVVLEQVRAEAQTPAGETPPAPPGFDPPGPARPPDQDGPPAR